VHTGFWWENLKERDHLQDLDRDGRIILMDLKELGMSSSVSGLGPVVVSYDRSNKTSLSFWGLCNFLVSLFLFISGQGAACF